MSYLLYVTIYCIESLMSAFETCHKIYLFGLFCDKTFVPSLILIRNHAKCFLTVNYIIFTSLALVLKKTNQTRMLM